ncbi:MAG: 3-hydroxyacyl-ACP dehydratase [Chitinophagaceae bacterium]
MILAGDFYTIAGTVTEVDKIAAVLKINPEHEIFRGHFPGQPVVPGVCMMQIVKELVETATSRSLRLRTGLDLKFLSIIDPGKNNTIHTETNYTILATGDINVTSRLFYNETTFFKFKGVFTS